MQRYGAGDDGALSCSDSGYSMGNRPGYLAAVDDYMYVTSYYGGVVYRCVMQAGTGNLQNCAIMPPGGITPFNSPQGITFP